MEGVYSNEINLRNALLRKRARLVRGKKGWYLRSRNIENNWLCVCFFSASDMTKKRQDGDTLVFDMSEAYAKAFSGEETWENRFKKPLLERKAMVVMHRPDVFLDRVKCFFAGNGLEEGRDFCMGLVHYRKDWEKFTYKDVPWELFHKEGRFKSQQEFRIALNPESQKVREMLKGGQEICIGSIEDCAMLKSHFYKGAEIRVKGDDVRLEVRDLSNMTVPPHEMEFVPLMTFIGLSLNYIIKCEIGSCVYDAEMIRSICDKVLKDKYNIAVDYEKYMLGTDSFPLKCYHGANAEVIRQNEEKDTYFYLKNYKGLKVAPLGALFVWDGGEWKRYTDLTYKLEGIVRPLMNRKEKKSEKLRLMFIKAVVFFVKMGAESEKSGEN